jgi:glutamate dehydrogenase (NAD(P)+)
MDNTFRYADDLGPAKIIQLHAPECGLKAILVVDNVAAGPALGGLRMAPDVSVDECFRLARAMTLKNAAAGLPHGGGKSVLFGDPRMEQSAKERLIRALACALADERDYIFGPDMGTDEQCMAWVKDEIGRAVGLPRELGGIPLDEIGATGWGIFHTAQVALRYCSFPLAGARVVIQGFGAVGKHAMRYLAQQGALLIAATDTEGTVYDPAGLDVAALTALKDGGRSVVDHDRGSRLERDACLDIECDIWIPAARPDVITETNVSRLKTRLVIEGANIPITPAAERLLHDRGVVCVPDFIANAGGVICAAVEYRGGSQSEAFAMIEEKLCRNTEEVLKMSGEQGLLPREAAMRLAAGRVRKAMTTRRWGVF